MRRRIVRAGGLALAAALSATPAPSDAIAPAVLMMVKQMVQQSAASMVKGMLSSAVGGMGCKGMALQGALAGAPMSAGLGGRPGLPAGMAMPTLPAGVAMPGVGLAVPGAGTAARFPQAADLPPELAERMRSMVPANLADGVSAPPGMSQPDLASAMARMQQAMAQPLSPAQTLATLDELSELGMLPPSMRAELTECMALVPSAGPALGSGMAMMRTMLPQMRQARAQLYALSPEEQDEVAAQMAQELSQQPADARGDMLQVLDGGFFPPRIATAVKAKLAAR